MIRENKVWGERWVIRRDSIHETAILLLQKDTRCSWHKHKTKWNLFVVLKGKVGIVTEDGEAILTHGEEFMVAPGTMHEFRVYEHGVMIEEMFVEYDPGDIERENEGGVWSSG